MRIRATCSCLAQVDLEDPGTVVVSEQFGKWLTLHQEHPLDIAISDELKRVKEMLAEEPVIVTRREVPQ